MKIHTIEQITVRVEGDQGQHAFYVNFDPEKGATGTGGRLLAECGDGQRIEVDTLTLFRQVFDVGFQAGRRYQREKGGHE